MITGNVNMLLKQLRTLFFTISLLWMSCRMNRNTVKTKYQCILCALRTLPESTFFITAEYAIIPPMNNLTLGILAHVDAGKTTLTEDLLYLAGVTRKIGRVDHGDAFLDTDKLEKERCITIFSKEAAFDYQGIHFNLIDTPGHVDFSGEMERALSVLDAAIIVISALDGATAHTKTVFRLLSERAVPTFLFINKMDQAGADRAWVLNNLKNNLSEDCVTLDELETIASTEEAAMDEYLESGELKNATLSRLIKNRHIFPCFFGSALKNEGVKEFLDSFCELVSYPGFLPTFPADFGARVYNISRDEKGVRLTHVKITGGRIAVKDDVCGFACESPEKINQIRVYSGRSFEQVSSASAGDVCTFVGPAGTFPGQGLGFEEDLNESKLSPVLSYHIILPEGCVPQTVLPKLLELGDEDPLLNMRWDEGLGTVSVMLMGEVQADVLKSMIRDRVGIDVSFSDGEILYKETIAAPVEGVGHYEPLRHYAEVHLLLEPAETGSGISLGSDVSTDDLALNWQRLIFTHLSERDFQGVLTGSALTDVRITLVAGRDHIKHTEGGDFRESTYRAVRQGLMEAESVLLEPYFDFTLELPPANVGRALNDLNNMSASFEISESDSPLTVILGTCPAITICNYQSKVLEYTRGQGRLSLENAGYKPCHNAEEVISRISYDPDSDKENPSGSIFCSHGAGVFIPWDKVKDKCHLACIKDIDK